jgi:cytochrome c biogenesis protein CcmG/thiol:disulfide interchange protein DsbE
MGEARVMEEKQTEKESKRVRWGAIVAWVLLVGVLAVLGLMLFRSRLGTLSVGEAVPDFTLTTFSGQQIAMSDLGGQVVVINFWASWCVTCGQEADELELAWREYADQGVIFLGVDYVDTAQEALEYLDQYGITYPNGPDLGRRISLAFRLQGVPETYIVGRSGLVTYARKGPFSSLAEIKQVVEAALAE